MSLSFDTELDYIDHVELGQSRVVEYFKTKENYLKLLEIFLQNIQDVEDAFHELAQIKDLDTVTGIWLDYLGKIIGEDRSGREDEVYRAALNLRIAINTSDGTAPVVREILKTYTESDSVRLAEGILSWGQVIFNGTENDGCDLIELLSEILPVTTAVTTMQDTNDTCFFPAWEVSQASVTAFNVFDGTDVLELDLVLSEGTEPSQLYVSTSGETTAYDPDTTDNYILEWEEPVVFEVYDGSDIFDLELQVDESTLETMTVNGTGEGIVGETLLPWEITEDSTTTS